MEGVAIDDVGGGAWDSGWRNLTLVISRLSVSIASGFLNLFALILRVFRVLSSNTKGFRNFSFNSFFWGMDFSPCDMYFDGFLKSSFSSFVLFSSTMHTSSMQNSPMDN